MIFTGISVFAGLLGFLLAWQLYYRNPQLPQKIAAGLGGLYEAVVHKYYIDELYATLFVKPLIAGSALILWHGIDQDVIDASVDNSAHGANEVSDSVRHMQSGQPALLRRMGGSGGRGGDRLHGLDGNAMNAGQLESRHSHAGDLHPAGGGAAAAVVAAA